MDITKANELSQIANQQMENAKSYADARVKAGKAEYSLKILLTSKLKELRGNKKNLGIEMALLMLMEDNETARNLYAEWMEWESKYKGLEKLLEAYASKLITEQAIMKRFTEGEKWGA